MRNAVECWEANGGKMGDFQQHSQLLQNDSPPPCFFRQTVKKGWYRGKHYMTLDGNFKGQEGQMDNVWP